MTFSPLLLVSATFLALASSAPLTCPERSALSTAVGSVSGLRTILSKGKAALFQ